MGDADLSEEEASQAPTAAKVRVVSSTSRTNRSASPFTVRPKTLHPRRKSKAAVARVMTHPASSFPRTTTPLPAGGAE
ncbi:MAG: hypothetical protein AB1556_06715 [Bacillota bacterium]